MDWDEAELRSVGEMIARTVSGGQVQDLVPPISADGRFTGFGRLTGQPESRRFAGLRPTLKSAHPAILADLRAAIHRQSIDNDHEARQWIEQLLRVCELKISNLRTAISAEAVDATETQRRIQHLRMLFLECFFHLQDARFVSLVLKLGASDWIVQPQPAWNRCRKAGAPDCIEMMAISAGLLLRRALDVIRTPGWHQAQVKEAAMATRAGDIARAGHSDDPVVVFSPSRYSLHTLAAVHLLVRQGAAVRGVLVRRMFNMQRIAHEFARDGSRLLRKAWNKLVLGKSAYRGYSFPTLPDRLRDWNVSARSIDQLARQLGIRVEYCDHLNDERSHRLLAQLRPRLVLFTGGGIVRSETIARSGDGVLNCHMGALPYYRGMDVVEWPILQGREDQLGFTVHFMNDGIDTGDLLSVVPMSRGDTQTINELRAKYEVPMVETLVDTAIRWLNGTIHRRPQALDEGRQHFIMHPELRSIAEWRFAQDRQTA